MIDNRVTTRFVRFALMLFAAMHVTSRVSAGQTTNAAPWSIVGQSIPDFDATIDRSVFRSGQASVFLRSRVPEPGGPVALSQPIRANDFRNQRVRFTAWTRAQNIRGNGIYVYVNVNGPSGASIAYEKSAKRLLAIAPNAWIRDTVSVLVPADANMLWFGAVLDGSGELWIDDVSIEKVNEDGNGTAGAQSASTVGASSGNVVDGGFETTKAITGVSRIPLDTARAASSAGLDAMIAFARLAGYVRFFHPTDSVVATNWHYFLTKGIRAAESAPTRDSLIKTLSN
ncbi:MAG: hypothetical protein ABJB66_17195, partial [Gemmatimonadaceae bacterium]